jgi:N-acetylneuraminate lyase
VERRLRGRWRRTGTRTTLIRPARRSPGDGSAQQAKWPLTFFIHFLDFWPAIRLFTLEPSLMSASLLDSPNRILPALVTPLTPEGALDVPSAEQLIDFLYAKGVGGLYVTGSTGEGIYLDADVRRKLVELAVAMSRSRGKIVAHVGAIQASQAFELAAHAARVGADAVASIPPFVGGFSWDEVQAYYRQLCQASSAPVVAYHFPALTGLNLSLDQLISLANLPGVAGLKFSDNNLYLMQRLIARLREDQIVYNGPDHMLALGLQMGAQGGIGTTYNVIPEQILAVAAHCAAGRFAEAVAVQKQANEVIEALLSCQGIAATKQVLYWQGLIANPICAPPRASLTETEQADLRRRLERTVIASTLVR